MIKTYVSVAFLADTLQVSERVIRYWAARRLIPGAIKIGRSWRFRLEDATAWLENKHSEMELQPLWSPSINDHEVRSIRLASMLPESQDESPLARELREMLLKKAAASKRRQSEQSGKLAT